MIPGTAARTCPACTRLATTVREPGVDGREMVLYQQHWDGSDRPCVMSGKRAALAAVAFTAVAGCVA